LSARPSRVVGVALGGAAVEDGAGRTIVVHNVVRAAVRPDVVEQGLVCVTSDVVSSARGAVAEAADARCCHVAVGAVAGERLSVEQDLEVHHVVDDDLRAA
jgi:F420-0:gamma-glutamyl ligase